MSFVVERVRHRIARPSVPRVERAGAVRVTLHDLAIFAERVTQLAERMRPPLNHEPTAFHEDKSDLVNACRQLRDAAKSGIKPRDWDELPRS